MTNKMTTTTLPTVIDSTWLKAHDACTEQRKLFEKEWPEEEAVTKNSLSRASEIGLDLDWFAKRATPKSLYAEYRAKLTPIGAEYKTTVAPLYAEYQAELTLMETEYQAKTVLLDAKCEAKRALINMEYKTKLASLYAEYKTKVNAIVLDILLAQYTN